MLGVPSFLLRLYSCLSFQVLSLNKNNKVNMEISGQVKLDLLGGIGVAEYLYSW
uniref:Uncharacterized protein n=1 Tax=Aegilops tauschii subsp. strangulata TaxID=200361 RepID=A0A453SV10_AEGTS